MTEETISDHMPIKPCLDALFGHFKQSANKPSPRYKSKVTFHRPNSIFKAMEIAPRA